MNTPRTSREGNKMILPKEEQTIVSYRRFSTKQRKNLKTAATYLIRVEYF